MRSKDEAGAPREHRYYKRVIRRPTTICGGLAVVVGLSLPVEPLAADPPVQSVPATPASPAPPAAAALYETVWTVSIDSRDEARLALLSSAVVLAVKDAPVEARALENGQVAWRSTVVLDGAPVAANGWLVGVGGGQIHAISATGGQPDWSVALEHASPGPLAMRDVVVVPTGEELRAYRTKDGSMLWRQAMGAAAVMPPVDAGASVVVTLAGNVVAAVDAQSGAQRWRTTLDSTPGSMAVAKDRLLFGTASGICALELASGHIDWCFRATPVPAAGAPFIDGDLAYVALRDNTLRAFSLGGTLRRLESLPARPTSGPIRAGTHLAVPLATSGIGLLALSGAATPPVLAFEPAPRRSLDAAAVSADGTWIVTLSAEVGGGRSLTAYRRKPPAAPPAPAPPAKSP